MKRTSLKTAISELQAKVSEIVNNSLHTDKMRKLLLNRELNNFSLNVRRKTYFMDIDDGDMSIVADICESVQDTTFEARIMPLITGADERAMYFEN